MINKIRHKCGHFTYSSKFEIFFKRIVSICIDNLIKSSVLKSSKSENDLIEVVNNDSLILKIFSLNFSFITYNLINPRINYLTRHRYMIYDSHLRLFKPGIRLPLTHQAKERKTNRDRVLDHLADMIRLYKIPAMVSEQVYLLEQRLGDFYLSTTHEPKRLAAGIIYLASKISGYYLTREELHNKFGVNPTTTNRIKRVTNLLR